jgi:sugar phosphate isomerase/epimerase
VAHAFVEGGMRMVSRYLRTFNPRLAHIHFSDNLGLGDDHIGIGQGLVNYVQVMRLLRRLKYSKSVTLEVYSSRKDLRESLRIVRQIEEIIW